MSQHKGNHIQTAWVDCHQRSWAGPRSQRTTSDLRVGMSDLHLPSCARNSCLCNACISCPNYWADCQHIHHQIQAEPRDEHGLPAARFAFTFLIHRKLKFRRGNAPVMWKNWWGKVVLRECTLLSPHFQCVLSRTGLSPDSGHSWIFKASKTGWEELPDEDTCECK